MASDVDYEEIIRQSALWLKRKLPQHSDDDLRTIVEEEMAKLFMRQVERFVATYSK